MVSSIMIGIITYISVLERTKEIGVLRAIGASKRNISSIFNAETFIVGLFSGILGIATTLGLLIPTNMIIHNVNENVTAVLPTKAAIILVIQQDRPLKDVFCHGEQQRRCRQRLYRQRAPYPREPRLQSEHPFYQFQAHVQAMTQRYSREKCP